MSLRRALVVFAAVVAGLAVLDGAILSLQAGYALSSFSAGRYLPGIVGVGLLRSHAARIPVIAACIAVILAARGHAPSPDRKGPRRDAWIVCAAVIPAAALAAMIALLTAAAVAATVFGVSGQEWWSGLRQFVRIEDFGYGLAKAFAYSLLLSVPLIFLLPRLARAQRGLLTKIVAAWLVGGAVLAIVDVGFGILRTEPEGAQTSLLSIATVSATSSSGVIHVPRQVFASRFVRGRGGELTATIDGDPSVGSVISSPS